MKKEFTGRIFRLRDDIDTDIIIPTQHLSYPTMDEMKTHAFEPYRPELPSLIKDGDIIVAGKNFGCGSSREQAPEVLAALKISCVIAKSFARIFFRNAINNGLLLLESDVYDDCAEGDILTVRVGDCIIYNGKLYPLNSMPEYLMNIIEDGGLVKRMQKLNRKGEE